MISPWLVYFIMMLDNVNSLLSVFFIGGYIVISVILIILIMNCAANGDISASNSMFKKMIKPCTIFSVCAFLSTFIPSTNQMAAILILPKMANSQFSQEIQKMPADLVKLADKYIQKQLEDNGKNK